MVYTRTVGHKQIKTITYHKTNAFFFSFKILNVSRKKNEYNDLNTALWYLRNKYPDEYTRLQTYQSNVI